MISSLEDTNDIVVNENNSEINMDEKTKLVYDNIKNDNFKKNILDNEKKLIVSSVYFKKKTKLEKDMTCMVWQQFRHRGKLNVNDVIKKYGRENLIINYCIYQ